MEIYYTKIIESIAVIILFIIIRIAVNQLINKTIIDKVVQKSRSHLLEELLTLFCF